MMILSIIIPVWNGETYIGRALECVLKQDYDIDVLVVDDGSSDATWQIVESYCKKDRRVRFLENKLQKGVTGARYYGVQQALGQYVFFMDADDTLPELSLSRIISTVRSEDVDVVIGDINDVKGQLIEPRQYGNREITTGYQLFNWIMDNSCGYIWGKAIRKELFLRTPIIPFNLKFCEDYIQMMQVSYLSRRVIHLGVPIYNYIQNPDSVCNKAVSRADYADRFYFLCLTLHRLINIGLFAHNAITQLKIKYLYYARVFLWINGKWRNGDSLFRKAFYEYILDENVKNDSHFVKGRYLQTRFTALFPWIWSIGYVFLLKYKYHRIK